MSGFPFAAYRAVRFGVSARCPHCSTGDAAPWGGYSGRRRYRCRGCQSTFSDFTGTPFAYLKRLDAWPAYLPCLCLCASVRLAAKLCRIHRDTAFRWRHRFLGAIRKSDRTAPAPRPPLLGAIHLGDEWLPHSEKGSRSLGRAPRRTGFRGLSFQTQAAWIAIACGEGGGADASVVGPRRAGAGDFARLLNGRAAPGATIVGASGEYGAPAAAARLAGCLYEKGRFGVLDPGDLVLQFWRSFVAWLERFRGVSTRYLENYLRWHGWVGAPLQWRCSPLPWLIGTTVPADRVPGRFPTATASDVGSRFSLPPRRTARSFPP